VEFQAISSNLSWNDDALYPQFYEGLKKTIKDEVIKFPPKTLRELIAFATRIDNHQHQHRKPEYRTETITNTEIPPKPDPDIDKEQRRQYRIANNLCLFCGNPRNQKDTCPKLAKKLASAAAVTTDSIT